AALARLALGESDDASVLLERARGILVTAVGELHPDIAISEHNLAESERERGKLDDAIAHERAAYDILKAVYGDRHPGAARALSSIARLTAAKGDVAAAVGDAAKGGDALEQSTSTILSLGSESEKLA